MEKIIAFIKLIDDNYFGNQKEKELITLYESLSVPFVSKPVAVTLVTTAKSTCTFTMKNGSRKGEVCGKGCMKGNSVCSLHKEKPVQEVHVHKSDSIVNEKKRIR